MAKALCSWTQEFGSVPDVATSFLVEAKNKNNRLQETVNTKDPSGLKKSLCLFYAAPHSLIAQVQLRRVKSWKLKKIENWTPPPPWEEGKLLQRENG